VTPVTVELLDPVIGAPGYRVAEAGTYELLELVPCRREIDTNGPICAFLGATVAGIDPNEVTE
jgi:hypothetical protein